MTDKTPRRTVVQMLAAAGALGGAASAGMQFPDPEKMARDAARRAQRRAEDAARDAAEKEIAKTLFPLEQYGAHVSPTNPFLDRFQPKKFADLRTLPRTPTGGFRLAPGAWRFEDGQGFCLKPGSYDRPGGAGFFAGELKGKLAPILRTILGGAYARPDLERRNIQRLIWGVIAGREIRYMHPDAQAVAAALLSPQQIAELDAGAYVPPELTAAARRALPKPVRETYDAMARLKRIAGEPDATYEQMERAAVLRGDPPPSDDDIPAERWSWMPAGYFVRFFSERYQVLTTEIVMPERARLKRDSLGRIIEWAFANGDSVKASYLPGEPIRSDIYPQADGHRFASVVIRAFNAATGGFETASVENRGFCFLEKDSKRRGSLRPLRYAALAADYSDVAPVAVAFLQSGSIPIIDITEINEAAEAARERQEFYEDRIRAATEPPSREDVDNMFDMEHYADGVEAAFGDGSDRAEWLIDHFERQNRALAYATNVIASLGEPSEEEPVHEPSATAPLPAAGGYGQIRGATGL